MQGMNRVTFKAVFISVFIGTALVVGAMLINSFRPSVEVRQPSASLVKATGKCAQCHRRETSAVVHQYETSRHAARGINCLNCHKVQEGQESLDHKGFIIAKHLTAKNCAECHTTEYEQFLRSRHAAPAWAAVAGDADFTKEQIAFSEKYHKGAVRRAANPLTILEGPAATGAGRRRTSVGRVGAGGPAQRKPPAGAGRRERVAGGGLQAAGR